MSLGLRVLGHPVHAALSDFPLVFLLLWVALDGIALVVGSPLLWMLGRWALIGDGGGGAGGIGGSSTTSPWGRRRRGRCGRRRRTWR
jgi:hypothetical protein